MELIFWKKRVVERSFTADGNLLQPTGVLTEHPHTSHFLVFARMFNSVARDIGSRCSARHTIHVSRACVSDFSSTLHFVCTLHALSHLLLHPPDLPLHLLCGSVRREFPCVLPRMRSLTLWSTTLLSKVMSTSSSTTTTSQRPLKFSSRSPPATPMPSNLHDKEISDYTIGRALSSPLFTQEREDPASRRQAYHSFEESLLPSQSLSVCQVRTGRHGRLVVRSKCSCPSWPLIFGSR